MFPDSTGADDVSGSEVAGLLYWLTSDHRESWSVDTGLRIRQVSGMKD